MRTAPTYDSIEAGRELPTFSRTPTTTQLVMYAGAEGDYVPLHFDHHIAVEMGHPGVIVHGWLTYAILLQAVSDWIPPGAGTITRASARYLKPTYPGDPVICRGRVIRTSEQSGRRIIEIETHAENGHGEVTTTAAVTIEMASTASR